MNDNVNEVISNLTEREKKLLKERFDVDCEDPSSLKNLDSKKLEITVEKIKEIEDKALKKLNSTKS